VYDKDAVHDKEQVCPYSSLFQVRFWSKFTYAAQILPHLVAQFFLVAQSHFLLVGFFGPE
jgi:hypothetical protein